MSSPAETKEAPVLGFDALTFRSFRGWRQDVDFGPVTLIYGYNGTGKSTLATALATLLNEADSLDTEAQSPSGSLRLAAKETTHQLSVELFTQDHVRDSVSAFLDGKAGVIWSLDAKSKGQLSQIRQAEQDYESAEGKLSDSRKSVEKAEQELEQAKARVRNDLRDLGDLTPAGKLAPFDMPNFTKASITHARKLMASHSEMPAEQLGEDALDRQQARGEVSLVRWPDIPSQAQLQAVWNEAERVWRLDGTNPESSQLDVSAAAWIRSGYKIHEPETSCKFCGGRYSRERSALIHKEMFTDKAEVRSSAASRVEEELVPLRKQLDHLLHALASSNSPGAATSEDVDTLNSISSALSDAHDSMSSIKENPNQDGPPLPQMPDIEELAILVDLHNAEVDQAMSSRHAAGEKVLNRIVRRHWDDYQRAVAQLEEAKRNLAPVETTGQRLKGELQRLREAGWTQTKGAEELTRDLQSYLGHSDLSVESAPAGYRVMRQGMAASHLSEGERTALALLHFISRVTGKKKGESDREHATRLMRTVIWVDDPVTSMDDGAKILASLFIADRLWNRCSNPPIQLIISTHDSGFLRLLKTGIQGNASTLHLSRSRNRLHLLPPKLLKSENALLLKDVAEAIESGSEDILRLALGSARRLVESHVNWRLPGETLTTGFQTLARKASMDPVESKAVITVLHQGSHAPEPNSIALDHAGYELRTVHTSVLDVLRKVDPDQFDAAWRAADLPQDLRARLFPPPGVNQAQHAIASAAGVDRDQISWEPFHNQKHAILFRISRTIVPPGDLPDLIERLPQRLGAECKAGGIVVSVAPEISE